jgi:hypothetical protein
MQALARLPGLLLSALKSWILALKPSEARSHKAAMRALLRSDASTTLVRLLTYVSALGGLALVVTHVMRSVPPVVPADPAPVAEWIQVAKPFPAFSLPMSELADSRYEYAMRRHAAGSGRQDIMTWGTLQGAAPHLMVEIYRPVSELTGFDSAGVEIAARLHGVDMSATIKPAGEMETKFGAMSLVEFSLRNPVRQCLGFTRAYEDPQLQILGWHCVTGPLPVERDLVACALDRLTLLAAGSEPKVRELFARAELRRNFCGQRSHLMAPTPKLGPGAPPPELRRGRVAAS